MIAELQRLAREGIRLSQAEVGSALAGVCDRYFGGMVNARRAAGLDVDYRARKRRRGQRS